MTSGTMDNHRSTTDRDQEDASGIQLELNTSKEWNRDKQYRNHYGVTARKKRQSSEASDNKH